MGMNMVACRYALDVNVERAEDVFMHRRLLQLAEDPPAPMHEITFSTIDKPKLLTQLTSIVSEIGLNIEEAHVFSTADGFSLDVFVVDGWPYEFLHAEIDWKRITL
ncbi:hypothetical protein RND71_019437 [Anisodus tanguticus]|uniref:ACT domain-containing protein n=1 Tax=Anisodus tanguticus TaxID=243964 RepID=A0AAE1RZ23_9SOLA|nr:hypothetical protein RND71_019437 [Anisodus tanguticus]